MIGSKTCKVADVGLTGDGDGKEEGAQESIN